MVFPMEITATNQERAIQFTRGVLRIERATGNLGLWNSSIEPILEELYREARLLMTGGEEIEMPSCGYMLEHNDSAEALAEFAGAQQGISGRYRDFSTGIHDCLLEEISMKMVELEEREEPELALLCKSLIADEDDFDQTILSDLMFNGNQLAYEIVEFRKAFYEKLCTVTIPDGSSTIAMSIPAPTLDFLQREQCMEGYQHGGVALRASWEDWNEAKNGAAATVGKHNTNCFKNSGDPRLYHFALEHFSDTDVPLDTAERTAMMQHANTFAHDYHMRAALELNSLDHEGSLQYFVHAITTIMTLQHQIDLRGESDPNVHLHRELLQQQIAVLVSAMQEYHQSSLGVTTQEELEDALSPLATQCPHLGDYIEPLLLELRWKELAAEGKELKDEIFKEQIASEEQVATDATAKPIIDATKAIEKLERQKLGVIRIVTAEAKRGMWEEPLEYLPMMAEDKAALYYQRNTWRTNNGTLSKAEAFELQLLAELARKNEVTNWVFTEADGNIKGMHDWMASQGVCTSQEWIKREIQAWIRSGGEWNELRQHFRSEGKWPGLVAVEQDVTERDGDEQLLKKRQERRSGNVYIQEEKAVTSMVNYWQALNRTIQELGEDGIDVNIALFNGLQSTGETNKAAQLIIKLEKGSWIDVGGWTAQNKQRGNICPRADMMGIHHTNMTRGYNDSSFDVEDAFQHGAFVAAQKEGYGKTHQTSGIEFAGNQRIYDGFTDQEDLSGYRKNVDWSFKMGRGSNNYDAAEYVCFTPGGPASAPVDIEEETEDDHQPVFSGGGWSPGGDDGGGLALM